VKIEKALHFTIIPERDTSASKRRASSSMQAHRGPVHGPPHGRPMSAHGGPAHMVRHDGSHKGHERGEHHLRHDRHQGQERHSRDEGPRKRRER
jgi:hypothetical protein